MRSTAGIIVQLLLLVCLASGPSPVSAVPWSTSASFNPLQQSQQHQTTEAASYASRNVFPQLTWLRDTVIEKIFGIPPKNDGISLDHEPTTRPRPSSSQLPATLLAKYGGDVVLRFNVTTPEEETALAQAADTLFLDVWEFTNNWADIRLREDDIPSLLGLLPKSLHKAYSPLIPDLARTIYQSYPSITFAEPPAFPPNRAENAFTPALSRSHHRVDNIFFRHYQPYSVIVPWMRLMASMFTSHVRMINIGISYEGRDIPALRVGVHPTNAQRESEPRRTIVVTGGAHAREWIAVSTVNYLAWSFITGYGKEPAITRMVQEFDWVFIPTLNVDGYVYTWENDRLWRKNRQQTNLRFCRGLDLDRGYGFQWHGSAYQSNPCSESYPGDEPFQAVESHRFAEWAKHEQGSNNVSFVGLIDLHSYSQQILYPYTYTCKSKPPALENLEELAEGLAKGIRLATGQTYLISSACHGAVPIRADADSSPGHLRLEQGGGSAIDWFYHEMGARYSYQIRLRDTGSYGFLLPSESIVPTGEEILNSMRFLGDFLLGDDQYSMLSDSLTDTKPVTMESSPEAEPRKADEVEGFGEATVGVVEEEGFWSSPPVQITLQ